VPGVNVRIETIVRPDVADRIMEHVSAEYFAHWSFIAYVVDVGVARSGKYT
jgi:nitrogen regulatory protein P-II 2